jgi:glycosyltransferase involved in cell wall biosynthesis
MNDAKQMTQSEAMSGIREVNVFTLGDSADIRTWSNVPYFFTETLISKGVKVNRIDISPIVLLDKLHRNSVLALFKKLNINTSYVFYRGFLHFIYAKWLIRRATRKFKNANANIFMTASFSSTGYLGKLSVLFHDWNYEHFFSYFEDRNPGYFERASLKRENKQIEKSDLLLPLFPGVAEYMKKRYPKKNIYYLGNVINSVNKTSASDILEKKKHSYNLLFIGSKKYADAAHNLIEAYEILKPEYPSLKVDIIGMYRSDFNILPEGVSCHGYLDKGNADARNHYYSLLENAKVFVNTSEKWGAFSATLEAMYFYIPAIVAPYNEFTKTFGKEISFGTFCEKNTPDLLANKIKEIFNHKDYASLCKNSHNAVKDFTWSAYIDKVIAKIEEELEK